MEAYGYGFSESLKSDFRESKEQLTINFFFTSTSTLKKINIKN